MSSFILYLNKCVFWKISVYMHNKYSISFRENFFPWMDSNNSQMYFTGLPLHPLHIIWLLFLLPQSGRHCSDYLLFLKEFQLDCKMFCVKWLYLSSQLFSAVDLQTTLSLLSRRMCGNLHSKEQDSAKVWFSTGVI